MPTVVTNENMLDVIQHKPIPEFKAPEPAKAEGAADTSKVSDTARDVNTGKFVSKSGEKTEKAGGEPEAKTNGAEPVKADTQADVGKTTGDDADDDADLPERVRKTIGKKHRAMREAEEFAESQYNRARRAEARAQELEQEIQGRKGPAAADPAAVDADEPKPENFKTVGEYAKAFAKFEVAKALAADRAESQQRDQKHQVDTLRDAFEQRKREFVAATPDYEEVIGDTDVEVPNHMARYIAESEVGPQLGYYLAKPENKSDVERLKKLSPIRAIAELGKLEVKLAEKKPEPKIDAKASGTTAAANGNANVSKAPAPIEPLSGQGATTVQTDPAKMTFKELREFERQRAAKSRSSR